MQQARCNGRLCPVPGIPTNWSTRPTRVQTFHDDSDGTTVHAQFAEPYCARVRESLLVTCQTGDWAAEDGGAMVVMGTTILDPGRGRVVRQRGLDTGEHDGPPEAVLARELRLCSRP